MLASRVLEAMEACQVRHALTNEEFIAALLAFAYCNRDALERLLAVAERMEAE